MLCNKQNKLNIFMLLMIIAVGLMVCSASLSEAAPMGTAFTYQGHLYDSNSVANGEYDFRFSLYADPCVGSPIGSDVNKPEVDVIDGYFTVELDFESGVFDGNAIWLDIGVRPGELNDPCAYTPLSPRQELTPASYALHTRGIFVDDNGNVDIGTTSPGGELHIKTGTGGGSSPLTNADRLVIESGELSYINQISASFGGIYFSDDVRGRGWVQYAHSTDVLSFGAAGLTRLSIDSSGNVGIGTTNPLSKLSVGGDGITNVGVYGEGYFAGVHGVDSGSDSSGYLGYGNYGVCGVSGNVGVFGLGTISGVEGKDSDTDSYGRLGYHTWGGYFVGDGYFSGNVGIGTTTPATKLDVVGTITATGGTSDNWNTAYGWGDHAGAGYLTSYTETDPTVAASVKDGVSWGELSAIPAGFADGVDDVGGADFDWTISGSDMYTGAGVTGNVGIGTTNPLSKLSVGGNGYGGTGVYGEGSTTGVWGSGGQVGVWGESDFGAQGRLGFASYGVWGSDSLHGVYGSGINYGVYATGNETGVYGYANDGSGNNTGVKAEANSTGSNNACGVASKVNRDGTGDYWSGFFNDSGSGGTYNGLYADERSGGGIDAAEYILDTKGDTEAGDVLAADPDNDESVIKSSIPYDSAVVGIVSTQPHMLIGMELVMDEETGERYEDVSAAKLALAGRVPVKVTDENGPIERGDLLTTSSKSGYAMKWTLLDANQAQDFDELKSMLAENERRRNAVVGKALGNLDSGDGKIVALVKLQ